MWPVQEWHKSEYGDQFSWFRGFQEEGMHEVIRSHSFRVWFYVHFNDTQGSIGQFDALFKQSNAFLSLRYHISTAFSHPCILMLGRMRLLLLWSPKTEGLV